MGKWGLALGGGGILGLAHVGVLQVLEARGLRPPVITGTSAGAIVAGLYASGVDLTAIGGAVTKALAPGDESLDLGDDEVVAKPGTCSRQEIAPLTLSGLIGGDLIEALLDRVTGGARMADAQSDLAITAVDIVSGSIVVFTNKPPGGRSRVRALDLAEREYVIDAKISEAIRASISIPGVFRPKKLRSWRLVDGGVRDMVPVYEARRMGADEVVAVDLGLHVQRPQEAKNLFSILSRSFQLASRENTARNLAEHASLTLQPEVWEPGIVTPAKCRRLIEAGRICAEGSLHAWPQS